MEDIPKTVKWLLAFANLGCTLGEPNPQRYKSYHTDTSQVYITNKHIPKLKRPPIELLPPEKKKNENTPRKDTIFRLPLYEQIKRLKPGKIPYLITDDGYVVSRAETGEPVFHGKNKDYPSIKEFEDFFLKERIPFDEKRDYGFLITCWYTTQSVLYRVLQGNDNEEPHPYVKELFDYGRENKPSHKLSQRVNECVWDFWDNKRALHSRLRQCRCCGGFWIKNGKQRFFCSKVCNDVFNKQSRHSNSRSASASKKARRNRKKKNDYKAIKEFYVKAGHSVGDAEIYANEWICGGGKTLESLKKEYGKR